MKREVYYENQYDRIEGRKWWRKRGWFVGKNWECYQDESLWDKWFCFYVYKRQYELFPSWEEE